MSRLISHLSKKFDFNLFNKRDSQLKPTQEKMLLYPDIEAVLKLMENIKSTSSEINNRKAGHLKIACLPGFATSHLPAVIAEFLKDRPDVSLTIKPDRPERISEWMIAQQYDFGIIDGFSGHPSGEQSEIDIRTVYVFPQGHAFGKLHEITPLDIENEKLIHSHKDSLFFKVFPKLFNAR